MDLGRTLEGPDADPNPDVEAEAPALAECTSIDLGRALEGPDATADVEAEAPALAVCTSMDLDRTLEGPDPVADVDAEAPGFSKLRQVERLRLVAPRAEAEVVCAGRTVQGKVVGVRAGVGWGVRTSTIGSCTGAGLRTGAGAGAGTGTAGLTAGAGTRFAGTATGTGGARCAGPSRRPPRSRPTPSCASTLASAAATNRRSSHCGHRHVFHRARQR